MPALVQCPPPTLDPGGAPWASLELSLSLNSFIQVRGAYLKSQLI